MTSTKEKKAGASGLIKTAAKSAVLGIVITVLLLLGISALAVAGIISLDMSDEYVICSVIIGSAVSGATCAKKMGRGVITAGLTAAGVYLVVILIGSIFTVKPANEGTIIIKIIIASMSGGCFGGVLRLYRKTKKSKIRKRI